MTSSTKNVKLGTCNVFFDGKDLGLTKGGVEVEVSTSTHEVMVDQHGNTPVGELINGRTVMANVPLAETTLDNLLTIMPGAMLVTDGEFATGSVTFSTSAPVTGDKIAIHGTVFTFKTTPKTDTELPIPASVEEAAQILSDAINGTVLPVYASYAGAVVTITAETRGVADNIAIVATFATGANVAVVGMENGADVTGARVRVGTGVNINLIDVAKELKLRPIGTLGEDDFIISKAACPGALNFTYGIDQERIYQANFKGYVDDNGDLFSIGDADVG
ncbi:hypothetical protein PXK56_18020 [Phaeobacter gallaeciensis]|uniref:hypothetical protein n=1 Tax=Phaeobacter gallaeciensis TaxID=60890 RepID=UPI002380087F|nr:hypothetical protein [Phaeobacter gallaeciensis]MDE4297087.1 hypothetical protein [Phaeobacter gallaeciensis]